MKSENKRVSYPEVIGWAIGATKITTVSESTNIGSRSHRELDKTETYLWVG